MKTGELLRRTRLDRGLSLAQVARDLYVQEKYIQALEEGNYEVIPGETYQRAYFKKYAEYLDLSDLFNRLASSDNPEDDLPHAENDSVFGGEWDSARWIRFLLRIALFVIIIVFASLIIKHCTADQPVQPEDPRVPSTQQTVEVVPPDEVLNNWEIPNTATTPPPSINEDLAHRIVLIATGRCWVTLNTRDGNLFYDDMYAGDTLEFSDFIGFHLSVGAPEKLDVKFNGELIEWGEGQMEMYLPEGFMLDEEEPEDSEPEESDEPDPDESTENADSGTLVDE